MKIERYEYDDFMITDTKTGEKIVDHEGYVEEAGSLIAFWINEIIDEPTIKDDGLKKSWEKYFDKVFENEEWPDMEEFFSGYDNPDWKVLETVSYSLACGPVRMTSWIVVPVTAEIKEIKEDEE